MFRIVTLKKKKNFFVLSDRGFAVKNPIAICFAATASPADQAFLRDPRKSSGSDLFSRRQMLPSPRWIIW
jgi:hypothetical protein